MLSIFAVAGRNDERAAGVYLLLSEGAKQATAWGNVVLDGPDVEHVPQALLSALVFGTEDAVRRGERETIELVIDNPRVFQAFFGSVAEPDVRPPDNTLETWAQVRPRFKWLVYRKSSPADRPHLRVARNLLAELLRENQPAPPTSDGPSLRGV